MPATARPDCAIVIPARFASSRFPGKPLADILGKPMIRHVWERCVEALGPEHVYVANRALDLSSWMRSDWPTRPEDGSVQRRDAPARQPGR